MQYKLVLQAALLMATLPAQAQQASPDPANAQMAVPATRYPSAFATYQPFREADLAAWRELNDEVARAGGHVGIFGGASGHAGHGAAKPTASKPATKPAQAAPAASEAGQAPARGAPQPPAAGKHH